MKKECIIFHVHWHMKKWWPEIAPREIGLDSQEASLEQGELNTGMGV